MPKPKAEVVTDKYIVESYGDSEHLLMLPDGSVQQFNSKEAVEGAITKHAALQCAPDQIHVATIEWRNKRPKETVA